MNDKLIDTSFKKCSAETDDRPEPEVEVSND